MKVLDDLLELGFGLQMTHETIECPLTGGSARLIKEIPTEHLVSLYKSKLDFDVRPFLDVDAVQLYHCEETGYEFFAPGGVMGPPAFYEALYKDASWAYSDTKWEYEIAKSYVTKECRVLDVGSGAGQFLASVNAKERVGLETNKDGRAATPKDIIVLDEFVESHAASKAGYYDAVTAIQVLEHIFAVRPFLEACQALLKPGGILILSVPNNDGFVGRQELPLNMPPHHMGRWNRRSLSAIANLLDLNLLTVEFEPMQEVNLGWYQSWMEQEYLPRSRISRSLYHRLGFAAGIENWLAENRKTLMGHTILAAYRKPQSPDA